MFCVLTIVGLNNLMNKLNNKILKIVKRVKVIDNFKLVSFVLGQPKH